MKRKGSVLRWRNLFRLLLPIWGLIAGSLFCLALRPAWAAGCHPAYVLKSHNTWKVIPANNLDLDSDNLFCAIEAATASSVPDPVIVLGAGTFMLGKARPGGEDYEVITPGGKHLFIKDAVGESLHGPEWCLRTSERMFSLRKRMTLRGEVAPNGKLLTLLTIPHPWEGDGIPLGTGSPSNPWESPIFILSGADGGTIKFENLKFYGIPQPIWSFRPYELTDCIFDWCPWAIISWVDTRSVYPLYARTNADFRHIQRSRIRRCKISNFCISGGLISGLVAEDNVFGPFIQIGFINWTLTNFASKDWYQTLWAWNSSPDIVNTDICRDNIYRRNLFINSDRGGQSENVIGLMFDVEGQGGILEDNLVENNTFLDFNYLLGSIIVTTLPTPGVTDYSNRNNAFVNNRFVRCSLGISIGSTMGSGPMPIPLEDIWIFHNQFEDVRYSDSPETTRAIMIENTTDSKVLGNDYSESRLPGWSAGGPGCLELASTTWGNLVVELPSAFPKGTKLCDQILDKGRNHIAGLAMCKR